MSGCGDDDSGSSNNCNNSCQSWQQCNTNTNSCIAKDTMCDSSVDCANDGLKTQCNTTTHLCEEPSTTTCTSGEQKCQSNQIFICLNGGWTASDQCETNQQCTLANNQATCETKESCTGNAVECSGNTLRVCTDGSWVDNPCGAEKECREMGGIIACFPGTFDCSSCNSWESCDTTAKKCTVKVGECGSDPDCTDDAPNTKCNTESHICIDPNAFNCNTDCATWQQCTSDNKGCEPKVGMCANNTDCVDDAPKTLCNTANNMCEEPVVFDCGSCQFYEDCDAANNRCVIKSGMCKIDDDCSDDAPKTVCNTTSNVCEEPLSETCTNGDKACEGTSIMFCASNVWVQFQDCGTAGELCEVDGDNASCISNTFDCSICADWQDCVPTERTCKAKAGMCGSAVDCIDDAPATLCNIDTNACEQPCTNGDKKCDGTKIMFCSDSSWIEFQNCNNTGKTCEMISDNVDCVDPVVGTTTIPDVNNGTLGQQYTTKGIVLSIETYTDDLTGIVNTKKINLQDGTVAQSGILLYFKPFLENSTIKVGDEIEVTGILVQYPTINGFRQIDVYQAPSVSSSNNAIVPAEISANQLSENYLNMKALMKNTPFTVVQVANYDNDYVTLVQDSLGTTITLQSFLYRFTEDPHFVIGAQITKLSGLVMGYINVDTKEFSLWPISAADISFTHPCGEPCADNQICDTSLSTPICIDKYETVTIKELKTAELGMSYQTTGVVTSVNMIDGYLKKIYIQDQNSLGTDSGMLVYYETPVAGSVSIGDKIVVEGMLDQYPITTGYRQLEPTTAPSVTSYDSVQSISMSVSTLYSSYIYTLVTMTDGPYTVTQVGTANNYYTTLVENSYGQELAVSSTAYRFNEDANFTDGATITTLNGVLTGKIIDGFETLMVMPRDSSDMVFAGSCTDGETRCSGDNIMICSSNNWSISQDCTASSYVCKESGSSASCVDPISYVTISQLRSGSNSVGDQVSVSDVVITGLTPSGSGNIKGFYIQDGSQGLNVYLSPAVSPDLFGYSIGDVISITGVLGDYSGAMQITIISTDAIINAGYTANVTPISSSLPMNESVEAVLIQLSGTLSIVEVGNELNFYNTTMQNSYGTTFIMRSSIYRFTLGGYETFSSITGIVTEYNGVYSIQPRYALSLIHI